MRLGVKPAVFLGRLLVFFLLTYVCWKPLAPAYTYFLAGLTRNFLHLTEISSDPQLNQVTEMEVRQTTEGGLAIMYRNRIFPAIQQGIPVEWVQANLVLLIPLMLAMPAASYRQRFTRLGLALVIAVVVQVLDITVTVKSFYAHDLGEYSRIYYPGWLRRLYQFGDAFVEGMDTQLFPFAIWAGIHFNQLLGRAGQAAAPQVVVRARVADNAGSSRKPKRRARSS